jgi:hypothetical protein
MNTSEKQESAKLILQLYDLRREERMRQSRDWWFMFNPTSASDFMTAMMQPDNWKMRQAIGYWEMTAGIVNHGAIDEAMFHDTNGEFLLIYAKVQPFLAELRKQDPKMLAQVEKMVMRMPDHEQKLEGVRQMLAKFAKK